MNAYLRVKICLLSIDILRNVAFVFQIAAQSPSPSKKLKMQTSPIKGKEIKFMNGGESDDHKEKQMNSDVHEKSALIGHLASPSKGKKKKKKKEKECQNSEDLKILTDSEKRVSEKLLKRKYSESEASADDVLAEKRDTDQIKKTSQETIQPSEKKKKKHKENHSNTVKSPSNSTTKKDCDSLDTLESSFKKTPLKKKKKQSTKEDANTHPFATNKEDSGELLYHYILSLFISWNILDT